MKFKKKIGIYIRNLYLVNVETGEYRTDNAWVAFSGEKYFSKTNGTLYRNQFISFGLNKIYYMQNSGAAARDIELTIKTIPYSFDKQGLLINRYNGFEEIDNNIYYFTSTISPKTGWFTVNGQTYYADK